MGGSFQLENGTVTILFQWANVLLAKAQAIINYATLYLHNRGYGPTEEIDGEQVQIPFVNLSNQQKLTMVFNATTRLIKEMAKTGYVESLVNTTREDAIEYADDNLVLEDN